MQRVSHQAVMALSITLLISISIGILGSMKLSTVAQGSGAVMVLVLGYRRSSLQGFKTMIRSWVHSLQ